MSSRYTSQLQYIHYAAAGLLGASACLKIHQLVTRPVSAAELIGAVRILTVLLVLFELTLAFWLVSCVFAQLARKVALLTFGLFCSVAFWKAIRGDVSCGCFGDLQVNPWITACIDLVLVWAIFRWHPRTIEQARDEITRGGVLVCICLIVVTFSAMRVSTRTIDDTGLVVGNRGAVIVDMQRFQNKQFGLARYIQFGDRLLQGEWLVVFYHEDCGKCQKIIQSVLADTNSPSVAFVEVPPYQSPFRVNSQNVFWTWLDGKYEWLLETPTIVRLVDGKVDVLESDEWVVADRTSAGRT